jgi:hypothetical protein
MKNLRNTGLNRKRQMKRCIRNSYYSDTKLRKSDIEIKAFYERNRITSASENNM